MQSLPSFWRQEVFHPMVVHFPIALLIMATLLVALAWMVPRQKEGLFFAGRLLLFVGTLFSWIALYTGNLADGIVSRQICDPTVLKAHQNLAFTSTYLFTGALFVELALTYFKTFVKPFIKLLRVTVVLLMLGGSAVLGYTGHLGAQVVYQQGGGVYHPSEDCREF